MDKLELLKQLAQVSPSDAPVLLSLAKAYKEDMQYNQALQTLTSALPFAEPEMASVILKEINIISTQCLGTEKEDDTPEDNTSEDDVSEDDNTYDIHDNGTIRLISKNNTLDFNSHKKTVPQTIDFSQVGGLTELKNIISMKIIKPFKEPELFQKFMKKTGGGLLLYGPPGCGKTFIAKATAGQCRAHFKAVKITDILDPYLGRSEQNIADLFSTARAKKPCILFFDEIDAIGYNRSKTSSDSIRTVVDTLLSEIEGIDTNTDKLLIIGATNMPWDIDPALRRPGRFDKAIFVYPPDLEARKIIFKLKIEGRPVDQLNYDQLALETNFYSGADIEHVVEQASETVLNRIFETGNEDLKITQDVLMQTIKSTKPSTLEWLRTISTYIRYANQTGLCDDVERYLALNKGI